MAILKFYAAAFLPFSLFSSVAMPASLPLHQEKMAEKISYHKTKIILNSHLYCQISDIGMLIAHITYKSKQNR